MVWKFSLILEKMCPKDDTKYFFENHVNKVVDNLKIIPSGIRDIILVRYIEEVSNWLVSTENVFSFLSICFKN